jgi:hypothetical protein
MARVSLVAVMVSMGEADAVVSVSARASVESFIMPLWRYYVLRFAECRTFSKTNGAKADQIVEVDSQQKPSGGRY